MGGVERSPRHQTPYFVAEWPSFGAILPTCQHVITPRRRQKTKECYDGIIQRHILPALGNSDSTWLSPSHVADFESDLLRRGMAPKGVYLVHTVLSGAMKHRPKIMPPIGNAVNLINHQHPNILPDRY